MKPTLILAIVFFVVSCYVEESLRFMLATAAGCMLGNIVSATFRDDDDDEDDDGGEEEEDELAAKLEEKEA